MRRLASAFFLTALLAVVLIASRYPESGQVGLRAQYFPTTDWRGSPARVLVDSEISDRQLLRSWRYTPPDTFSVRWSGYLFVERAGAYSISTTSDDGSQLYVDGQLIVDNGGLHGPLTRTGGVMLERGSHAVLLQYVQGGGSYHIRWTWARSGEAPADIPGWLLSPRPRSLGSLIMLRLATSLRPLAIWIAIVLGMMLLIERRWLRRSNRFEETLAVSPFESRLQAASFALFVVLAVVHTWPLASDPGHLSRNDNADTVLNEWTIAWVAHQAPRHPLQLFDGNMFYPERNTVAYSEALPVQSAMAAPLLWLGASPVLAYNMVLLAGFTLTGWTMSLVIRRWTGDWVAAVASGAMLAFNAHTLTRLPHLQAQHAEFLPLALLALDNVLRQPRRSSAIWLAAWMTLQSLTSVYLMVFTAVAIGVAVLARPEDWTGGRFRSVAPKLLGSAALASLALAPFLVPYWRLAAAGFGRTIDEAGFYAAHLENFLTSPSRFHALSGVAPALFPGVVPIALVVASMASGDAIRDARARMCLAVGAIGMLVSLGPAVTPGYEFFYFTLPILRAIRVSSRFGYLALVGVAVLGGYGVAAIRRVISRKGGHAAGFLAAAALAALVALEPLAAPIRYEPFDRVPPIYAMVAGQDGAVVAELPLPAPDVPFYNAPALLNSTRNWKPLVNGYSGFVPASYVRHYLAFKTFPASDAVAALKSEGITHVFVHRDRFSVEDLAAIDRNPALEALGRDDEVSLYRVVR